jgi:hypothetical protein
VLVICARIEAGIIVLCGACRDGRRADCAGDGVHETFVRRLAAQDFAREAPPRVPFVAAMLGLRSDECDCAPDDCQHADPEGLPF